MISETCCNEIPFGKPNIPSLVSAPSRCVTAPFLPGQALSSALVPLGVQAAGPGRVSDRRGTCSRHSEGHEGGSLVDPGTVSMVGTCVGSQGRGARAPRPVTSTGVPGCHVQALEGWLGLVQSHLAPCRDCHPAAQRCRETN